MGEPRIHVVQEGEHLPGIAAAYGFTSHKAIWDHPDNAELRSLRKNPNVLAAGDRLVIPERERGDAAGATEQRHRFVASGSKLLLRVRILDLGDAKRDGPCFYDSVRQSNFIAEVDGAFQTEIDPRLERQATLRLDGATTETPPDEFPVEIGGLDPLATPTGQRDRLNNLGYFAGFSQSTFDAVQFRWAVEEFQRDHRKSDGLTVTGVVDPATQGALLRQHGV